jgi:GT2 family glycosyltransferase
MSNPQPFAATRVAIVLVNWNGWRECIECIDSLFAQSHGNSHVFIVDNDSRDRSVETIVSWCAAPIADATWRRHMGVSRLTDRPDVGPVHNRVVERDDQGLPSAPEGCRLTLIRSGGNLGFAGGCNVGIKAAGLGNFDYFWFLNPDTVVDRHALVELIGRAERQPGIGVVGSTLRYYDNSDVVQAMGGARLDRSNGTSRHIGQGARLSDVPADGAAVEREMAYVVGASMLVSTKFISEIGLMEEDYFLYYEEVDWAFRGSGKFSLGFAPRSHVFHKSGVNSSKAAPQFSTGFYYRNRLRFVARFLPGRLAAAKWSLFEEMLRHIARRRWGHARIVFFTLLRADGITADVTPKH